MEKTRKHLKLIHNDCECCKERLVKTHSRRTLQDTSGVYKMDIEIGRCINKKCSNNEIRMYPKDYRKLVYPKSSYSMNVYAIVGYERLVKKQTVGQIYDFLSKNYPHIKIKERSIENIFKRVQVCLAKSQQDKDYIKGKLQQLQINQLCLSVDGIQPEQGNSILYVVREVQSGIILYGRFIEHSDTNHLVEDFFRPLKFFTDELDFKIGGWICDKQNALIDSIQIVFEGIPIQLCQAHFLKSMAKPIQKANSELGKTIKKTSRP